MISFGEKREISSENVSPMAKRPLPGTPSFIEVSGFCNLITVVISLPCPVPDDLQCIGRLFIIVPVLRDVNIFLRRCQNLVASRCVI